MNRKGAFTILVSYVRATNFQFFLEDSCDAVALQGNPRRCCLRRLRRARCQWHRIIKGICLASSRDKIWCIRVFRERSWSLCHQLLFSRGNCSCWESAHSVGSVNSSWWLVSGVHGNWLLTESCMSLGTVIAVSMLWLEFVFGVYVCQMIVLGQMKF